MDEENAEEEKKISENGPLLAHAYNILKKAMNNYWKKNGSGKWQFVRKQSEGAFVQSKDIFYIVKVLLFWFTLYQNSSFFGVN